MYLGSVLDAEADVSVPVFYACDNKVGRVAVPEFQLWSAVCSERCDIPQREEYG